MVPEELLCVCVRAHLVRERGYLMWLMDTVCTPTCAAIFCFVLRGLQQILI